MTASATQQIPVSKSVDDPLDAASVSWMNSALGGDEAVLWCDYFKSDRSTASRNALAEYYFPLIQRATRRLKLRGYTADEAVGAACAGLLVAIPRWVPNHRVKPWTYLWRCASGAVYDWLRELDEVSRHERRRKHALAHASQMQGRDLTWEQACDLLQDDGRGTLRTLHAGVRVDLDAPYVDPHGGYTTLGRVVRIPCDYSATVRQHRETAETVRDLMQSLTKRERLVLVLYYLQSLTMSESAEHLGIGMCRFSQLHAAVVAKLRRRYG